MPVSDCPFAALLGLYSSSRPFNLRSTQLASISAAMVAAVAALQEVATLNSELTFHAITVYRSIFNEALSIIDEILNKPFKIIANSH